MHAGRALLARARAAAHDTVAVVGTGKNVGKTVTVAALCDALARDGAAFGLCSIGRDGEAFDAVEGFAKPRLFLRRGALVATARALIARSPAAVVVCTPFSICRLPFGTTTLASVTAGRSVAMGLVWPCNGATAASIGINNDPARRLRTRQDGILIRMMRSALRHTRAHLP